ncbi:RnfABCDGE type electron transport complex subunit D [Chryseobacterium sp. OSA05B]|uniref:RnfABCDGE type electron transport complex subunit D n=1 Tax=Chryseobacterium sp. OSA05B TaxID=2862650 RepID=UPI001CBB31AE|nr:RnfABCDGE type electron transport complex subunit D [Chryseobacterium sp. OSA05B]
MKEMLAPYIKHKKTGIGNIMLDVIIALVPIVLVAYMAFGVLSLIVILTCVIACIISDLVFGMIFLKKIPAQLIDGSGIITGLLLAFTLSPITPWYVAAFGASMSILFGKILWGGVGKNRFNPALIGRECMVVFFPTIMGSNTMWNLTRYIDNHKIDFSSFFYSKTFATHISEWIYHPSGAVGEYSIILILIGGIYLTFKKRISWHIPITFLSVIFCLQILIPQSTEYKFSMEGLLLGSIYMATDMASSPSHSNGKIYYGGMLGIVVAILLYSGINFAYMSYGILILNGFSTKIGEVFKPIPWGHRNDLNWESVFFLSLYILTTTMAVVSLQYAGLMQLPIYLYIFYMIIKYHVHNQYKIFQPF